MPAVAKRNLGIQQDQGKNRASAVPKPKRTAILLFWSHAGGAGGIDVL